MAKTQWHPLFVELLKLLLQDSYDVDPEYPVSTLPRTGDVLVVRKHERAEPIFREHCDYNVIEFKGLSDHAELPDLQMLMAGVSAPRVAET